jgi:hypothetical protein
MCARCRARGTSFRGYADYMQTPAFAAALEQLVDECRGRRVAMMCAGALPWRCDAVVRRLPV